MSDQLEPPTPPRPVATPIPPPPSSLQYQGMQTNLPHSKAQPVWQFALLVFITFGLYYIYWFHRNWVFIQREFGIDITPIARAIFCPLYAISFVDYTFAMAKGSNPTNSFSSSFLGGMFLTLALASRVLTMAAAHTHSKYSLILYMLHYVAYYATILTMVPAVQALNVYWERKQPEYRLRTGLSAGEIVIVIIGSIIWMRIIFLLLPLIS